MDPHLLDYYNRELVYMREMAGEFAASHPKSPGAWACTASRSTTRTSNA